MKETGMRTGVGFPKVLGVTPLGVIDGPILALEEEYGKQVGGRCDR
jgi:hypothetical protein